MPKKFFCRVKYTKSASIYPSYIAVLPVQFGEEKGKRDVCAFVSLLTAYPASKILKFLLSFRYVIVTVLK